VRALRVFRILDLLARAQRPAERVELIARLDLPVPTAARLLAQLEAEGFVLRVGRGRYALGAQAAAVLAGVRPVPRDLTGGTVVVLAASVHDAQRELVAGLRRVLAQRGLRVLLMASELWGDPDVELDLSEVKRPVGLVVMAPGRLPERLPEALARRSEPVVLVGSSLSYPCDGVTWDRYGSMVLIAQRLHAAGAHPLVYFGEWGVHRGSTEHRAGRSGFIAGAEACGVAARAVTFGPGHLADPSELLAAADSDRPGVVVSGNRNQPALRMALAALRRQRPHATPQCVSAEGAEVADAGAQGHAQPWDRVGVLAGGILLARLDGDRRPPSLALVPSLGLVPEPSPASSGEPAAASGRDRLRAFRLLRTLHAGGTMSRGALVRALGLPATTTARLLASLRREGLVLADGRGYALAAGASEQLGPLLAGGCGDLGGRVIATDGLHPLVLQGVRAAAMAHGAQVLPLTEAAGMPVAGVIAGTASVAANPVMVRCGAGHHACDAIDWERRAAVTQAVARLLAGGCTRLVLCQVLEADGPDREAQQAFRDALAPAGIHADEQVFTWPHWCEERAAWVLDHLVPEAQRPRAGVVVVDPLGRGLAARLARLPWLASEGHVAVVDGPWAEVGRMACERLRARVAGCDLPPARYLVRLSASC
jgi:DNA-binding LacI/PurR family transcriptional regulator/DNA-binding MarR family transcriptional regulator